MLRARADHIIESNLCIYLIRRCSWPRNGANQTHTAATMSNRRSEWREIWQAPPHSSQKIKNHAESGQTPSRQQQQQKLAYHLGINPCMMNACCRPRNPK